MPEETNLNPGEVARLCLAIGERQFALDQCLRPARGRQQMIDGARALLQRRGDRWALAAFEAGVERVWSEAPLNITSEAVPRLSPLALFPSER